MRLKFLHENFNTPSLKNIIATLRIGFSHPVSHIRHWRSNCPMEEISADEVKYFKDKCTFLSLFHFLSDYFDMDSRDFESLHNI